MSDVRFERASRLYRERFATEPPGALRLTEDQLHVTIPLWAFEALVADAEALSLEAGR